MNVHSVCVKESKVILGKPEESENEKTVHLTLPSAVQIFHFATINRIVAVISLVSTTVT